ncbi:NUDIX hydrolase [Kovacikia minuta CCNUW1]|uniref:NUDIX hydrolase n=1 Tax=Kovacikia minuta TaxID=2931930 RepID=UPI001CC91AAC|nr:NUDIX hydrolase [Kovacikia minuta]UBF24645.1 NUDIX hydrolase [Kovacikia minuta CCNUW1]
MESEQNQLKPWKILKTQEVFVAKPWITLSVQQVALPDGKIVDDYYQIALQEYAVIVAQTTDGRIIIEQQYKHGLGRVSLTLPGGAIEPGEDPLAAAKRELLEETGYIAENWQSQGNFVNNANYGGGKAHIFTANNAQPVAAPQSGDLEEIKILLMTPEQILSAVQQGDVAILGAIAAIALALNPKLSPQT